MKIDIYTPESLEDKTNEVRDQIIAAGWDGVIRYDYHISYLPERENDFLTKILSQPQVIAPEGWDSGIYTPNKPVEAYGNGVSFGGTLNTGYEYLTSVLSYPLYAPQSTELGELSAELMAAVALDGLEAAEEEARQAYVNETHGNISLVRRGFIRVLTPVRYKEE